MIKTLYLGWELLNLCRINGEKQFWSALYATPQRTLMGTGHSPEAALADAQRQVQKIEYDTKI